MLFVAGLFKKQTNAISFQNYSPELLISNEENFSKLKSSSIITYQYRNYSSTDNSDLISFSNLEKELGINYDERKINIGNKNNLTPLHIAVINRDIELIKLLLSKGAKTDIKDSKGKTAIDYALEKKDEELASLLLN